MARVIWRVFFTPLILIRISLVFAIFLQVPEKFSKKSGEGALPVLYCAFELLLGFFLQFPALVNFSASFLTLSGEIFLQAFDCLGYLVDGYTVEKVILHGPHDGSLHLDGDGVVCPCLLYTSDAADE